MKKIFSFAILAIGIQLLLVNCSTVKTTYKLAKKTVSTTYKTGRLATKLTAGTLKLSYKLGGVTFNVISAPLDWPMTTDIEDIGGLSPKEAVRRGKVKNAPYTVKGKHYRPMSVEQAREYRQAGVASWYGWETYRQKGGRMTANGEAFDPNRPTAAHKYLPLPAHVRVTNLENGRSMVVRVNDRGPFVSKRIIDLSAGAAKKLGFYENGLANVLVETVKI